jgi:hypothetical protein|eukprot:SAG25_NODE_1301_length_3355_cov_2.882371_1_plen_600_part_00
MPQAYQARLRQMKGEVPPGSAGTTQRNDNADGLRRQVSLLSSRLQVVEGSCELRALGSGTANVAAGVRELRETLSMEIKEAREPVRQLRESLRAQEVRIAALEAGPFASDGRGVGCTSMKGLISSSSASWSSLLQEALERQGDIIADAMARRAECVRRLEADMASQAECVRRLEANIAHGAAERQALLEQLKGVTRQLQQADNTTGPACLPAGKLVGSALPTYAAGSLPEAMGLAVEELQYQTSGLQNDTTNIEKRSAACEERILCVEDSLRRVEHHLDQALGPQGGGGAIVGVHAGAGSRLGADRRQPAQTIMALSPGCSASDARVTGALSSPTYSNVRKEQLVSRVASLERTLAEEHAGRALFEAMLEHELRALQRAFEMSARRAPEEVEAALAAPRQPSHAAPLPALSVPGCDGRNALQDPVRDPGRVAGSDPAVAGGGHSSARTATLEMRLQKVEKSVRSQATAAMRELQAIDEQHSAARRQMLVRVGVLEDQVQRLAMTGEQSSDALLRIRESETLLKLTLQELAEVVEAMRSSRGDQVVGPLPEATPLGPPPLLQPPVHAANSASSLSNASGAAADLLQLFRGEALGTGSRTL